MDYVQCPNCHASMEIVHVDGHPYWQCACTDAALTSAAVRREQYHRKLAGYHSQKHNRLYTVKTGNTFIPKRKFLHCPVSMDFTASIESTSEYFIAETIKRPVPMLSGADITMTDRTNFDYENNSTLLIAHAEAHWMREVCLSNRGYLFDPTKARLYSFIKGFETIKADRYRFAEHDWHTEAGKISTKLKLLFRAVLMQQYNTCSLQAVLSTRRVSYPERRRVPLGNF